MINNHVRYLYFDFMQKIVECLHQMKIYDIGLWMGQNKCINPKIALIKNAFGVILHSSFFYLFGFSALEVVYH
jgi:hypothetical protein